MSSKRHDFELKGTVSVDEGTQFFEALDHWCSPVPGEEIYRSEEFAPLQVFEYFLVLRGGPKIRFHSLI